MDTQMTDQLMEAGVLLAVGMSVVFAFLTLLIAAIHAIAWFCRAFPSDESGSQNSHQKKPQHKNNQITTSVSPQISAAIAAAVHTHRHTTLKN